ncbi:MAG: ACP S-malonyltransferase [Sumerlaeia bacterium]
MSKKIAFLFPGQGSQAVGMGRAAADRDPAAAALMSRADEVLGFPLSAMCFDGPEDDLKQTQNTQPALFASSAATLEVLRKAGVAPFATAGHSLGEYTALYAAGVFSFDVGLQLVRTRGEAFARAGAARPGAMAAVLGLDGSAVEALCRDASTHGAIAVPANFNDPAQTVISGDPAAVEKACEIAKERGAKRALMLPVSGAFHSPLVEPARETMATALDLAKAAFQTPNCHFVNNVAAEALTETDAIVDSLVAQVTSAVRWVACVEKLQALGAEAFIEVGSGKVLAGLCRRIAKDIPCHTTESEASLEKTLSELT